MAVEPAERGVLLSIRPRYVEAILAATKTVELRRRRIQAATGTQVLMYSSTPVKAVVGSATLIGIVEAIPARLWAVVGPSAGITRAEFDSYFEGAGVGYGLHLGLVRRLPQPISLTALRRIGLEPPQSFRYLTMPQQHQLESPGGSSSMGAATSGVTAGSTSQRDRLSVHLPEPPRPLKVLLEQLRHALKG